ncbi:hypothetical protein [Streptomyces sp. NPDC047985]|uniref:hypothetical protein n=1 Tax=unclassified Streptomyces TaxID=2593676 RepID=UPI003447C891
MTLDAHGAVTPGGHGMVTPGGNGAVVSRAARHHRRPVPRPHHATDHFTQGSPGQSVPGN